MLIPKNKFKRIYDFMFKGRDSTFHIVRGFNQAGKTDFVLWLMENLYGHGYFKHFGLNQHIDNSPFDSDFIRDLKTLQNRTATLKKPYLYFLDELAKSANKNTAWEKTNIGLIKALEIRRKYKLHIIGAGIGEIDRRIMSPLHLDTLISKQSLTTAIIHHIQRKRDKTLPLYNIPRTDIKFKEYEPAEFLPEPLLSSDTLKDLDIDIAIRWAQKSQYTGSLSKPAYYNQIRRGILKLSELVQLSS